MLILPSVAIGLAASGAAAGLLLLIELITNLAYSGSVSVHRGAPSTSTLGAISVLIPAAGGLLVGVMARFGTERIRGHGIPEAMESILTKGSRMEPLLAILKPISSAVSIGTGGPFGAEGPIIVTGGAMGSFVGQLMHSTALERRILLAAGAAAGMTAIFGTPLAAILLAVELLLLEMRPRSLAPVSAAVCAAAACRGQLVHFGLLPAEPIFGHVSGVGGLVPLLALGAAALGLCSGLLSWALSNCVYAMEDAFSKLPFHWMWWPAIGGLAVGACGLLDPRILGVGYSTIAAELSGRLALSALLALLSLKLLAWCVALGSSTSGGVLAPVLMMGAALGGALGAVLPGASDGTWALIGMAATLGATTGSPLTAIAFAVESTHDLSVLPALLPACVLAYLLCTLVLRRSILTEKIARRGVHVSREYGVDPLEALLARDVASPTLGREESSGQRRRLRVQVRDDATLGEVADMMLIHGESELGVLDAAGREVGVLDEKCLLSARERVLVEERRRERGLRLTYPLAPRLLRRTQMRPQRERSGGAGSASEPSGHER